MSDNNLHFGYEGLQVNVSYNPLTSSVTRTVTESGNEILHLINRWLQVSN